MQGSITTTKKTKAGRREEELRCSMYLYQFPTMNIITNCKHIVLKIKIEIEG